MGSPGPMFMSVSEAMLAAEAAVREAKRERRRLERAFVKPRTESCAGCGSRAIETTTAGMRCAHCGGAR